MNNIFVRNRLLETELKFSFVRLQVCLIYVLLFLFSGLETYAQGVFVVEEVVEYKLTTIETGEGTKIVGFEPDQGYWDPVFERPVIVLSFPLKTNDFNYSIVEVSSSELDPAQERLVQLGNEYQSEMIDYSVAKADGRYVGTLILPAIQEDEQLRKFVKIDEIKVEITPKNKEVLKKKSFTTSSVLSTGSGDWYKIGVTEDGLYKVDYSFLQNMGVDVAGLKSSHINLYGNAQGMLSEDNSVARIDDLLLNDIWMNDNGDGVFDSGDYFVFYGKGPHTVNFDGTKFRHETNNFTDTAYYFMNINSSGSLGRIGNISQSSSSVTYSVTKFNDFLFLEEDERNLAKSGQEWLGDLFDVQLSNTYPFSVANLSTSDSLDLGVRIGISTPTTSNDSKFTASYNGKSMQIKPSAGSGQGSTSPKARLQYNSLKQIQSNNTINVSLTYDKDGMPSAKGYLDYIEINCIRNLVMEGSQMEFCHLESIGPGNVTEYQMSNAGSVAFVWEVSDPVHPKNVNINLGSSIVFKMDSDSLRKFIAFTDGQFLTPTYFNQIEQQNLHGLSATDVIIITSPEFLSAAQRLSAHHETLGLTCQVVLQQQIFNEFSSGMRDPVAIRHFLKMFYDRAGGDPAQTPKFCTIIGDCSYDYR
ncbi:MAG: hypothetical protein H6598_10730, partial [Flavobacteriales bacterium]|nr:hypothetical protein [Flavobacteriales bacterium]